MTPTNLDGAVLYSPSKKERKQGIKARKTALLNAEIRHYYDTRPQSLINILAVTALSAALIPTMYVV